MRKGLALLETIVGIVIMLALIGMIITYVRNTNSSYRFVQDYNEKTVNVYSLANYLLNADSTCFSLGSHSCLTDYGTCCSFLAGNENYGYVVKDGSTYCSNCVYVEVYGKLYNGKEVNFSFVREK